MKILLVTMVAALAACGGGASEEDTARAETIAALTGDITNGQSLYSTTCSTCHGADGKSGTENEDVAGEAANSKLEAIEQILEGGGSMPGYASTYSDQEIADLVAYAASLN